MEENLLMLKQTTSYSKENFNGVKYGEEKNKKEKRKEKIKKTTQKLLMD